MPFLQETQEPLLGELPAWLPEALLWLGIAGVFVLIVAAAGIWTLVARGRELQRETTRLRALDDLGLSLERLVSDRDDLDLRRIEHVLIDLRDAQQRLEDALLRSLEAARDNGAHSGELVPTVQREDLGERVVNRLLALGYERVQIVTRAEKLSEIGSKDGEVLIEARREGVLHKGRVTIRSGRLCDVEIHPAYSIFP